MIFILCYDNILHVKGSDFMLNIERENSILELLKQKEVVKIQEIVDILNVSEATARRDLATLEKKELVKRV
ncbi:MAG: DeoR family transcriptional regulator, partial [Cetobacterium sp.]